MSDAPFNFRNARYVNGEVVDVPFRDWMPSNRPLSAEEARLGELTEEELRYAQRALWPADWEMWV